MANKVEAPWVLDIFSHVEQLLKNSAVDVAYYDGEFLDPEKLKELQSRYTTKNGIMIDIEDVVPVEQNNSLDAPRCIVTLVAYCVVSNKRTVKAKVKNSVILAAWAGKQLAGTVIAEGDDHSEGAVTFVEIQKEDQIPYVSVHALRVSTELAIDFTA